MVTRFITLAGITACLGAPVFGQGKTLSIVNANVEAKFDVASGRFALTSKPTRQVFLKDGRLSGTNGTAKVVTVTDKTFGRGEAIEVSYANGSRDTIMLFPELPFALMRAALFNQNAGPELVGPKVQTFSVAVDLGKPAREIKTLGTGGLLAPDKNPGSYAWLAVVEPASRNGVVLGWLTEDRGSGVVFSKLEGETVRAEAQIDYGHLRVGPGATEQLETLAVGWFEDARLGLEAWADAVAKVYDIHLPPQPVGYCTWYSQPHGGASDEKHLAEQSAFAAAHLAPFGSSVST